MEWCVAVIIIALSVISVSGLLFIMKLVSMVNDLRIENAKLKIDLRHK